MSACARSFTAAGSAISAKSCSRRKPSTSAATSKRSSATTWCSASVPPAPARPISPWPWRISALISKKVCAHHPDAARGGSRRAARLPARHAAGEGRSLPAPALRCALRHAGIRESGEAAGAQHDRSGAHRFHARPHVERQLHHSRRSAEQHARADEDGAHAPGLQLQDGGERRRHADRSARRASAAACSMRSTC